MKTSFMGIIAIIISSLLYFSRRALINIGHPFISVAVIDAIYFAIVMVFSPWAAQCGLLTVTDANGRIIFSVPTSDSTK